jgi:hypothetical protein
MIYPCERAYFSQAFVFNENEKNGITIRLVNIQAEAHGYCRMQTGKEIGDLLLVYGGKSFRLLFGVSRSLFFNWSLRLIIAQTTEKEKLRILQNLALSANL